MTKHWVARAAQLLQESLKPIPHEINELDWKAGLSPQRERLIEHLIALANYPGGGFLVFGVNNADAHLLGVTQEQVAEITNTIANLGRDAVAAGRIKRKDPDTGNKFAEYLPYWA